MYGEYDDCLELDHLRFERRDYKLDKRITRKVPTTAEFGAALMLADELVASVHLALNSAMDYVDALQDERDYVDWQESLEFGHVCAVARAEFLEGKRSADLDNPKAFAAWCTYGDVDHETATYEVSR